MIIKLNLYQTQTHTHKQQNKILRRWQTWGRKVHTLRQNIHSFPTVQQPCCLIVFGSFILCWLVRIPFYFSYGGGWSMRSYLFPIGSIDRSIAFLHSINQSLNISINQPTNQSINHWFTQSFSESICQSVKQTILIKSNQWNSQSVSQSIRQSHSQPFNEKGSHSISANALAAGSDERCLQSQAYLTFA